MESRAASWTNGLNRQPIFAAGGAAKQQLPVLAYDCNTLINSSSFSAMAWTWACVGGPVASKAWRRRIGNRQAQRRHGEELAIDAVEEVLDGLELAAQFARNER